MQVICLDLEGVLVPEIWMEFADKTGIKELMATTRDIPDYKELMQQRLRYLDQHNLRLEDIRTVISSMSPLPGARNFLDQLRRQYQVIILSDTFYEFASPLMEQLGWPTLFCHQLQVDQRGRVQDFVLRQADPKRNSVQALKKLNFTVYAAGDSFNDISMLDEADAGFLFRAPRNIVDQFPRFPLVTEYDELRQQFDNVQFRAVPEAAGQQV